MTHHDQTPPDVKQRHLYFALTEMFPAGEPLWQGAPNYDSFLCPWMDGHFVATNEDDSDGQPVYMIGLYPTPESWSDTGEWELALDIRGIGNVVTYLDDITELTPEGVDFWAWAVQWTKDAAADGRIAGLVGQPVPYRED